MKNLAVVLSIVALAACTTEKKYVVEPGETPSTPGQTSETGDEADDEATDEDDTGSTTKTPAKPTEKAEVFGAKIKASSTVIELEKVIASPETYAKTTFVTSGTVRQNCNKKGCWMDVRPDNDVSGTSITVRFKNYGFFVPLDSRGAKVKMEGIVKVTTMTPEQVQHMEEEGATVPGKKEDGSAQVVELTANGVEMTGRKK